MILTSYTNNNKEHSAILFELMKDILYNSIIIGDINAPMNKLSDIYKITKDDQIIGGWSVFHGFDLPTVVIPPTIPEGWEAIHSMIKLLDLHTFYAPFPRYINDQPIDKPWKHWDDYNAELQFTDFAYQLDNKEIKVTDISRLPKIRAATIKDTDKIVKYFKDMSENEDNQGFFNPEQLKTDIFVIAEENDKIVAVGGAHFETPMTVQIGNIYVSKSHRGIGLGRAITTACVLGIIRTKRLPTLFVNNDNDIAINLYKSMGFKKYNEIDFYRLTKK